jgi:hypothetical protein
MKIDQKTFNGVLIIIALILTVISWLTPDIIPRDYILPIWVSLTAGFMLQALIYYFPQIEQIRDVLTKLTDKLGIVEFIDNSDRYYALLEEAIRNAETLRFTHLTRDSPDRLPTPRAKDYWESFTNSAKKNPDLWIKRISSIDTKEKLKFLEEKTIELKDIENYGLTYYLPTDFPPLLGFEIIGEKEVFFFGPHAGTGRYLHVTDKILSQGMAIYFDEVWDFLHEKGFILKDMGETDEKKIREKFSKVREKLLQQEKKD